MADYTLSAKITADASQFNKEFGDTQSKLQKMGGGMTKLGKGLTKGLTLPIVGAGAAAIKTSMDFESSMSNVAALSGATGKELEMLEKKAREMGATTKYSATESADALGYMALSGWNAEQMVAAIEPTLKLAGAANLDLARASDIVTDTLSMYGMEAEEATRMTNVLAKAQATSNTDVEMLGDALVYVGASANAMGYDIEQSSALLGILANNGIKGSKAGTALNAVFRDMKKAVKDGNIEINGINVSVEDADGNFRSFTDILEDTEGALVGLTPVQRDAALTTIFGSQAMQGLNPLIKEGSSEISKYTGELRDSDNAAGDMYDVMQDNLKGAFQELKSAVEELGLSLGETLIPMVKDGVDWVGKWVDKFNALDDGTKEMIVKVGLFAAAIGPLLIVGGKVATGIGSIIGLFTGGAGLTAALGGATGAVGAAGGAGLVGSLGALAVGAAPIVAAVAGLGLIAVTGKTIYDAMTEEAIPAIDLFGDEVSDTTAQVVGDWIETNSEFETMMMGIVTSGETYTEELKEKVGGGFNSLATKVIEETQREKDESLRIMSELYAGATGLTQEQINEKLEIVASGYDDQVLSVEEGEKQINEILARWKERGGAIYDAEAREIEVIQEKMKKTGVKLLSETEAESQAILLAMEQQAGNITARQASDIIKNAKEQKDGAITEAEEEYTERLKLAAQLRAQGGAENEALADDVIREAERQRKTTISEANLQYDTIAAKALEKSGEHKNTIDRDTGEILTKWEQWKIGMSDKINTGTSKIDEIIQKTKDYMAEPLWDRDSKINVNDSAIGRGIKSMKDFMNTRFGNRSATVTTTYRTIGGNITQAYATGTPYARGGMALVGEEGPELVNIPRGSKVYTNKETRSMMSGKGNSGESTYNFNLNGAVINDPRDIREIAKELATEFNREVAFG